MVSRAMEATFKRLVNMVHKGGKEKEAKGEESQTRDWNIRRAEEIIDPATRGSIFTVV